MNRQRPPRMTRNVRSQKLRWGQALCLTSDFYYPAFIEATMPIQEPATRAGK